MREALNVKCLTLIVRGEVIPWPFSKDVVLAVLYKVYFVIRVILVGTNSKSKVTSSHTTPRFWKPENPVTFCGLSLNKSVSDY